MEFYVYHISTLTVAHGILLTLTRRESVDKPYLLDLRPNPCGSLFAFAWQKLVELGRMLAKKKKKKS
jgi:hypothetical protein